MDHSGLIIANQTHQDLNVSTNIKEVSHQQILTGAENLASPIKQPQGEHESPGPLSSMKFGSEVRAEGAQGTEQFDCNNTTNNQAQDASGILSKALDNEGANAQQRPSNPTASNKVLPMPINPSSSMIVDNQIDSFVINGVGTGLLNQTNGSI